MIDRLFVDLFPLSLFCSQAVHVSRVRACRDRHHTYRVTTLTGRNGDPARYLIDRHVLIIQEVRRMPLFSQPHDENAQMDYVVNNAKPEKETCTRPCRATSAVQQ